MKKAVILNSRQGLRPLGSDSWVKATEKAVRYAGKNDLEVLTSVGQKTWEVILYFVSRYDVAATVCLPLAGGSDQKKIRNFYRRQYRLKEGKTRFRFIEVSGHRDRVAFQARRDQILTDAADIIFPVSIRPEGTLDQLLQTINSAETVLDDRFRIDYNPISRSSHLEIDPERINPEIDRLIDRHLIHWTRSFNRPWPGETCFKFYSDLVAAEDCWPRCGLDTLLHILDEGKIRAASGPYRHGLAAVAFSSLKPSEAVPLMKWRARYRRMTFEPYGVAIPADEAAGRKVWKVFYGNPEMYDYLEGAERPYFQSMGTVGCWQPEQEHRHIGDFSLAGVPDKALVVIVRSPDECNRVGERFSGRIVSMTI